MRDIVIQKVDSYIERVELTERKINDIKMNAKYSDFYKKPEIEKLYEDLDKDREVTWNGIQEIIDSRIIEADKNQKMKINSLEHQQMISNVLKMVELLGISITPEQMNNIIYPFAEAKDYQTLSILERYSDKLPEDTFRNVEFPDLKRAEASMHENMKSALQGIFTVPVTQFMESGLSTVIALKVAGEANGYITQD
ncbi:MAG: hypothetical protein ACK5MV_03900 [Aminipila sp.]